MNIKDIVFSQIAQTYSEENIETILFRINPETEEILLRLKRTDGRKKEFIIDDKDKGILTKLMITKMVKTFKRENPNKKLEYLIVNINVPGEKLDVFVQSNSEIKPFYF